MNNLKVYECFYKMKKIVIYHSVSFFVGACIGGLTISYNKDQLNIPSLFSIKSDVDDLSLEDRLYNIDFALVNPSLEFIKDNNLCELKILDLLVLLGKLDGNNYENFSFLLNIFIGIKSFTYFDDLVSDIFINEYLYDGKKMDEHYNNDISIIYVLCEIVGKEVILEYMVSKNQNLIIDKLEEVGIDNGLELFILIEKLDDDIGMGSKYVIQTEIYNLLNEFYSIKYNEDITSSIKMVLYLHKFVGILEVEDDKYVNIFDSIIDCYFDELGLGETLVSSSVDLDIYDETGFLVKNKNCDIYYEGLFRTKVINDYPDLTVFYNDGRKYILNYESHFNEMYDIVFSNKEISDNYKYFLLNTEKVIKDFSLFNSRQFLTNTNLDKECNSDLFYEVMIGYGLKESYINRLCSDVLFKEYLHGEVLDENINLIYILEQFVGQDVLIKNMFLDENILYNELLKIADNDYLVSELFNSIDYVLNDDLEIDFHSRYIYQNLSYIYECKFGVDITSNINIINHLYDSKFSCNEVDAIYKTVEKIVGNNYETANIFNDKLVDAFPSNLPIDVYKLLYSNKNLNVGQKNFIFQIYEVLLHHCEYIDFDLVADFLSNVYINYNVDLDGNVVGRYVFDDRRIDIKNDADTSALLLHEIMHGISNLSGNYTPYMNELCTELFSNEYGVHLGLKSHYSSYDSDLYILYILADIVGKDIICNYRFALCDDLIIDKLVSFGISEKRAINFLSKVGIMRNFSSLDPTLLNSIFEDLYYFYECKNDKSMYEDMRMMFYIYGTKMSTPMIDDLIVKYFTDRGVDFTDDRVYSITYDSIAIGDDVLNVKFLNGDCFDFTDYSVDKFKNMI